MEQSVPNTGLDRAWAAAASALVGAVLGITNGVRTPGGAIVVAAVIWLGVLAILEVRRPVAMATWARLAPYALLLVGAVTVLVGRVR